MKRTFRWLFSQKVFHSSILECEVMGVQNNHISQCLVAGLGLIFMGRLVMTQTPEFCGVPLEDPFFDRIVGGVDAVPHEFPWIAKLYKTGMFHCGAELIADRYALTAGHCVTTYIDGSSLLPKATRGDVVNFRRDSVSDFSLEFGAQLFEEKPWHVVRSPIETIVLHPEYDLFSSDDIMLQTNDIAILRVASVTFTATILPICLPAPGLKVPDGAKLIVAGWGSTKTETIDDQENAELPTVLQKAEVVKISYDECKRNVHVGMHLSTTNNLTPATMFCAYGNNQDSCRGDSGGPAIVKTPQGFVLAGLISWGIGCNEKDFPAAYTQVSSYINFIAENTRDGYFLPHQ